MSRRLAAGTGALVEAPPRLRRIRPLYAIVAALLIAMAVSAVARAIFVEVQPIDIATAAVEAAAERDETRLAEYTRPSAGEQLLDLVAAGAEVFNTSLSQHVGGDAYDAVVELDGPVLEDHVRVQLLLVSDEGGWVVVEASPGR